MGSSCSLRNSFPCECHSSFYRINAVHQTVSKTCQRSCHVLNLRKIISYICFSVFLFFFSFFFLYLLPLKKKCKIMKICESVSCSSTRTWKNSRLCTSNSFVPKAPFSTPFFGFQLFSWGRESVH